MPVEIERKFLVDSHSWEKTVKKMKLKGVEYRQGYLQINDYGSIRIRSVANKGFITIKSEMEGGERTEMEWEIPRSDAAVLLYSFCLKPLIRKIHYTIHYDESSYWEVDRFLDENEGLILAEMEISHPAQFLITPSWLGKEVTDDKRYYNASLVIHPFKSWNIAKL
jgi:adenylate cyclase